MLVGFVVLALVAGACTGGDDAVETSTTTSPPQTTTSTVDPVAVVPADVRQERERPFEHVGVGLDHARHDDVVAETVVDAVRSPRATLLDRAGREDPAVADGDRFDHRL